MSQHKRQRRVLVVDRNREGAERLRGLLALNGFDVLAAGDTNECLQKAANFQPDVILVEASELTEAVLHTPDELHATTRNSIHIVAMTSRQDHLSLYELALAGFDEMVDPHYGLWQIMCCCQ